MANREACELYIEQEIKDQLAQGKKPWSIGKELSKWVEKLFEVTINPNTLRMRAERIADKDCTNVQKKSNNKINSVSCISTEEEKKDAINRSVTHPPTDRGGARDGAGRPKAVQLDAEKDIALPSGAMMFLNMAISQMDRIQNTDPMMRDAVNQMIEYCMARLENKN